MEGYNSIAWYLVTAAPELRDPPRALPLVQKARELAPNDPNSLNTLGVVLYRLGRFADAVPALEKSLAASAGDSDACDLYFLAMCHWELGDRAKAKELFANGIAWHDRTTNLTPAALEELRMFRTEAEALLAKP